MDDLAKALADPARRRLLVALTVHNPQHDMLTPEEVHQRDKDPEQLQIEMYHKHLPLLEDMGFIDWDRRTHEVVKGHRFDEIRPLLSALDLTEDVDTEDAIRDEDRCANSD